MNVTPTVRRALKILNADPYMTPKAFAVQMWPKSSSLTKPNRAGVEGAGLMRSAGGYLGKLERSGFVLASYDRTRETWKRTLTRKGLEAIK